MSLRYLLTSKGQIDRESFTEGALYLVGSSDACAGLLERRTLAGAESFADVLLSRVAAAFELRHEHKRREDGEVELRAALEQVVADAEAWIGAIDRTARREQGREPE